MAYIKKGTNNREKIPIGEKFGRLTIIEDLGSFERNGLKRTKVKAICDCGNEYEGFFTYIKRGDISSCGCLRSEMAREWVIERFYKHGLTSHPLVGIWSGMLQRCENKNNASYHNYGGRGVTVCEEWHDFKTFYDWAILNGWQKGLELDKDCKGTGYLYSPENCCFLTSGQNNREKRTNINITFNGETKCLTDWAIQYNLPFQVLRWRLNNGWTIEQAFNTPKIKKYADRIKTR